MVYIKRKPWKVNLLFYITPIILTFSTLILAQEESQTHVLQNEYQHQTTEDTAFSNQGQLLYEQALQQLETLTKIQSSSTSTKHKPLPLKGRQTGVVGLYHIATDSIWKWIDSYLTDSTAKTTTSSTENKEDIQTSSSSSTTQGINQQDERLQEATRLLEEAGKTYGNKDALFLLAEMYFYEKYSQPRDYKLAFDYYQKLANTGNATAQQMIGFMYATGVGNVIQRDQAQAFLHHTFAALGGDTAAEMTLGYRYLLGIGTDQSCTDAVYYYRIVAEKAINHYLSGPPGGLALPLPKIRLADDDGGVYGYGASVMTDKMHRSNSDKSVSIEEVLQYLRYLALQKGDIEAQLRLGEIYYHGSRNVPRDFGEALYFFKAVVRRLPSGKLPDSMVKSEIGKAIGQAAGYLGKMFMRGEGVSENIEMAYKWFMVGTELQDSASMNGLGLIQMKGEKKDYEQAIMLFKQAANLKNADARVNLAKEYMNHPSTVTESIKLFELAAETSKHLLAYWYLGQLYEKGIGMDRPSCKHAVSYYKAIAERGDWLYPTMDTAYDAYMRGDLDNALLSYMLAAERGYEIAQSNAAYLLDTDKVALNIPEQIGLEERPARDNYLEELALIYWSRSANQNNVDSRVKMGDYYYRGIGTEVDYDKAASCYRIAAELEMSPMAMWNLGWMYENGIGVAKDFHLAKRAYDTALTTSGNAYLPVKLSLIKLYAKYYWEWLIGGEVGNELFFSQDPKYRQQRQNHQQQQQDGWDELQDQHTPSEEAMAIQQARQRQQIEGHDDHNGQWNERGAEDELRRQYNRHKELEEQEDDMHELTGSNERHRRRADGTAQEDDDSSEEDELIESLIILGICLLVGWLVYVRQFRFGNNNNNNNQPAGPQQHDPLFQF
ncbi:uncharacterized protein BX664DRAFT_326148 [Halteromyces radiatus]|uniref:uncharacterized protein n=1 Tax=Halteromyces radiatus TaxID=101107 RepID=UPI00221FC09A|nr:uncharacterized protein BX664DRAFT_326148 [Halteromyces radiatus]KAI8097333.1 hypothetical protein BX664DRAFT_326148 [Halteromyces radiatus]